MFILKITLPGKIEQIDHNAIHLTMESVDGPVFADGFIRWLVQTMGEKKADAFCDETLLEAHRKVLAENMEIHFPDEPKTSTGIKWTDVIDDE